MPRAKQEELPLAHIFSVLERKYPKLSSKIRLGNKLSAQCMNALDGAYPVAEQAFGKVTKAASAMERHHMKQLVPLLIGLVVCFFGGCFTMLIAVVEVVHITSWDRIKASMHTLYGNYLTAREASKKDDTLDENKNGIPDVKELQRKELFSRKLGVFFRSIDPVGVKEALNALLLAFFAIIAALSDKFANALAFGCCLADAIKQFLPLESILEEALPVEQKRLAGTLASTVLNFIGMTTAVALQQFTITMHCAVRGARLFVENAIAFGKEAGLVEEAFAVNSQRGRALIAGLAVMGFLWQASNGFALSFPFNILLFPFTVADWLLGVIFRVSAGNKWA
ncbi:hypothetical protein DQ04_04571000 [Trypanosoma grayi]|uniref:hypothetical protein n=1 Tax=Trypanosoma grayi TaxID=71804 RepID=UPI0004F43E5F|nr:hypothetical protein DQ04_04571000 [Trypanosoma grayi]KEG09824.1 hypothetical protein DQ04_04571000 [Trypanosoma grayi]